MPFAAKEKAGRSDAFVFQGEVAPIQHDFSKHMENIILQEVERRQTESEKADIRATAAVVIQKYFRRMAARTRYIRHRVILAAEVGGLRAARQTRSSIALQRMCRGWLERVRYRKLLIAEQNRLLEAATKKPKPKGKGKADANPMAGLTPKEAAIQRNMNFVNGVRLYLSKQWEEAAFAFEAQQKMSPDGMTQRMIERSRNKGLPILKPPTGNPTPAAAAGVPGKKSGTPPAGKKR